jgi:hypothetical protein
LECSYKNEKPATMIGHFPLVAEREHARLMRNMSIEYGLLFLTTLGKWAATP